MEKSGILFYIFVDLFNVWVNKDSWNLISASVFELFCYVCAVYLV